MSKHHPQKPTVRCRESVHHQILRKSFYFQEKQEHGVDQGHRGGQQSLEKISHLRRWARSSLQLPQHLKKKQQMEPTQRIRCRSALRPRPRFPHLPLDQTRQMIRLNKSTSVPLICISKPLQGGLSTTSLLDWLKQQCPNHSAWAQIFSTATTTTSYNW